MTIAENESIRRLPLRHPRLRARPGMTLIELVVAVLILSVGLLALAGVAGAVARQIGTGGLHTRAAFVAQARLDSLMSVPCAGLAATSVLVGTSSHYMDGVQEKWVVEDGNDVKVVTDTIRIRGRVNPMIYKTVLPCRD